MPSIGQFSALNLPSNSLPTVTYGMLVDFLGEACIISSPTQTRRVFRWLKIHGREGFEPLAGLRLGQLLNVCQIEHAREVLDKSPETFVCATTRSRLLPDWIPAYQDRLLLVEQSDAFLYFCFLIMKLFTDSLLLCAQLDNATRNGTNLQAALEIAAPAVNARLSCFDASEMLIARANPGSLEIDAGVGKEKLCKNRKEIVIDGSPFATLQAESDASLSAGQKDLLEIISAHLEPMFRRSWDEQAHLMCPYWRLLTNLIEGKRQQAGESSGELQSLLHKTASAAQFKLLLLSLREAKASPTVLASHAQPINGGNSLVFAYKGDLCVLCFAEAGDSLLSHKRTQADAERHLSKFPNLLATSSQIFEQIEDLDLAYQQAAMTRDFLPLLDREPQSVSEDHPQPKVTPFEICLAYYLMSGSEKNERLLDFTFPILSCKS